MSQPPPIEGPTSLPPTPPRRLDGVWRYLVILATVYVVASLALGIVAVVAIESANHTMQNNARTIEQLQTDTNDNLCNQQAYEGGATCEGGDANGGSLVP